MIWPFSCSRKEKEVTHFYSKRGDEICVLPVSVIWQADWPGSFRGAQGAVGCHRDAPRVAVADQLFLGEVWVTLHLQEKRGTEAQVHCVCGVVYKKNMRNIFKNN